MAGFWRETVAEFWVDINTRDGYCVLTWRKENENAPRMLDAVEQSGSDASFRRIMDSSNERIVAYSYVGCNGDAMKGAVSYDVNGNVCKVVETDEADGSTTTMEYGWGATDNASVGALSIDSTYFICPAEEARWLAMLTAV